MYQPKYVQTIVCTKITHHVKSRWNWEKIWDGVNSDIPMQIWICRQDLKESFIDEAKQTFGKSLDQIVRLGAHPEILYPVVETLSE
jgi:hypothetical protein